MSKKDIIILIAAAFISGIVSVFASEIGKSLYSLTKKDKDKNE